MAIATEPEGRASDGRLDPRPPRQRLRESIETWSYIFGLSVLALVFALVCYNIVGNTTMHEFNYALPDTTPASHLLLKSEVP